jgi:two-component system, OmpR family, response regulator
MNKIRILLAEDDENLGSILKDYLILKGFEVSLYTDGVKAYKGFIQEHFDLCLLDVMMPEKDGFTLTQEIRQVNPDIPVLFLTAKNLQEDVLEGFKLGGDDYITKPFNMEELIFRIEAILKRMRQGPEDSGDDIFRIGIYSFDPKTQILKNNGNSRKLTTKESDLLKLLYSNRNEVLERNYALRTIWIDDNYFNARSMDVFITKLRKYLKNDPSIEILNVHGKGYKLIC